VGVGVGECGEAVGVGVFSTQKNVHVNSATGPLPQLKAPVEINMTLSYPVTGVVLKWNTMVVFAFCKVNVLAGMQFTRKSFASTLAGSAASLKLTMKLVGPKPLMRLPQTGWVPIT
jgi:hypothetical protein